MGFDNDLFLHRAISPALSAAVWADSCSYGTAASRALHEIKGLINVL